MKPFLIRILKRKKRNIKNTVRNLSLWVRKIYSNKFFFQCYSLKSNKNKNQQTSYIKRALSGISFIQKASMTVEAAVVIPIFIFCMANILWSFQMLEAQSQIETMIHQIGNEVAFYGYAQKYIPDQLSNGITGALLTEGVIRQKLVCKINESKGVSKSIKGHADGISLLGSTIMGENDVIDLKVNWGIAPFANNQNMNVFSLGCRYYGKAFTGYDVSLYTSNSNDEDPIVYITKDGSVYHRNRNCSYLNPEIEGIPKVAVDACRNKDGAKYHPCESCKPSSISSVVYVTGYGTRYHSSATCSGLKRTIYTVPLSEVGGRGPCSKCGY